MKKAAQISLFILSLSVADVMLAPPAARLTDFHEAPMTTNFQQPPLILPHSSILQPQSFAFRHAYIPAAHMMLSHHVANLGPLQMHSAVDILGRPKI